MLGYTLVDLDGEYSANPSDYFMMHPEDRFEGVGLVKSAHPYRTVTGRIVSAPRFLKSDPTLRDLLRIQDAMQAGQR